MRDDTPQVAVRIRSGTFTLLSALSTQKYNVTIALKNTDYNPMNNVGKNMNHFTQFNSRLKLQSETKLI